MNEKDNEDFPAPEQNLICIGSRDVPSKMNEWGKNLNLAKMEPIGTWSLPTLSSFLFQVSVPSTDTIPISCVPCGILPPYPDSTGRYDIAPPSAQAGTSWNQLSFCWSMEIIDRNGTGEPSGPSVGYPTNTSVPKRHSSCRPSS